MIPESSWGLRAASPHGARQKRERGHLKWAELTPAINNPLPWQWHQSIHEHRALTAQPTLKGSLLLLSQRQSNSSMSLGGNKHSNRSKDLQATLETMALSYIYYTKYFFQAYKFSFSKFKESMPLPSDSTQHVFPLSLDNTYKQGKQLPREKFSLSNQSSQQKKTFCHPCNLNVSNSLENNRNLSYLEEFPERQRHPYTLPGLGPHQLMR